MNDGHLPNLVVIGAMKCATTSLHYYLGLHPRISMSREKELNFFVEEFNWGRGVAWYRRQFDGKADVYGEASPSYASHPYYAGVPQRMASVVPDARLVYVLRDPLERLASHYRHDFSERTDERSFEDAVRQSDPGDRLICRSRYFLQIEQYRPFYPDDRILLITSEDLHTARTGTLGRVFAFLGVDPGFRSPRFRLALHMSLFRRRRTRAGERLYRMRCMRLLDRLPPLLRWNLKKALFWPLSEPGPRPVFSDAVLGKLVPILRDDVAALRQYSGRDFREWTTWAEAEKRFSI